MKKNFWIPGLLPVALLLVSVVSLGGCKSYGPPPETVPFVELERYAGLWHEIASNPVFFNRDLVGVTAEYTLREDGRVGVLNRGFKGSLDGPEDSITGKARVVDTATNSKLAVRFDPFFASIFEGSYWIVALDTENYQYAAVTDKKQMTLFILSRTPSMDTDLYNRILAELAAKQVDISRLRVTGALN